jgi:hypothetical protein
MSWSNPPEPSPRFVFRAFSILRFAFPFRFSAMPIFTGLAARFADRIAAFNPVVFPTSSSSFIASFLRFAFRERPDNVSLFGYKINE